MSFEPWNCSLPFSAPELRLLKAMCDPVVLARESSVPTGCQSVNCSSSKTVAFILCKGSMLTVAHLHSKILTESLF